MGGFSRPDAAYFKARASALLAKHELATVAPSSAASDLAQTDTEPDSHACGNGAATNDQGQGRLSRCSAVQESHDQQEHRPAAPRQASRLPEASTAGQLSAPGENTFAWSEDGIAADCKPPAQPSSSHTQRRSTSPSADARLVATRDTAHEAAMWEPPPRLPSPRPRPASPRGSDSPLLSARNAFERQRELTRSLTPSPRSSSASPRRSLSPRLPCTPRTPRLESWRPEHSDLRTDPEPPREFNIFFQNIKIAPSAPSESALRPKYTLPEEIFFYIHTSTYPCRFPLPREYPESQYLHRAAIFNGHEAAGPAIQLRFDPSTVVGLKAHHMINGRCGSQLVVQVPVTRRINPTLAPKQLVFQPTSAAMLHNSPHLPRIIVPVLPLGVHLHSGRRQVTLLRNTKTSLLKQLVSPWDGTPRAQRLLFALSRWKRVSDALYSEVDADGSADGVQIDYSDATVGTPFKFGKWYPRAALDVPPYTTIYFQNARISMTAPRPRELPSRHLLPGEVYFYVRTVTADVRFPLPEADYPSAKYLHCARVIPGHEAGGPAAHMVWSINSVVGLKKHHCTPAGAPVRSMQLVIVVPSTASINPGIEPTQLSFAPFNFAQLHLSHRLPRVIVPLYPRSSSAVGRSDMNRVVDSLKGGERLKSIKAILGAWRTFGGGELKLASFRRWARVCSGIESVRGYRPPEPQIGTPYVESLKDRGVVTNRARWPRLERAMHMLYKDPLQKRYSDDIRDDAADAGQRYDTERETMSLNIDVRAAQTLQLGQSSRRSHSPRTDSARREASPSQSARSDRRQPELPAGMTLAERSLYMYALHNASTKSASTALQQPRSSTIPRSSSAPHHKYGTLTSTTPRDSTPRSTSRDGGGGATPRSLDTPRQHQPPEQLTPRLPEWAVAQQEQHARPPSASPPSLPGYASPRGSPPCRGRSLSPRPATSQFV